MARLMEHIAGWINVRALLDTIADSELGAQLLKESDDGYNIIVGSTPGKPLLFHSYADHPRKLVDLGHGLKSTAAGRYQILAKYFDAYKKSLHLPDFGPISQDRIAVEMLREQGALLSIQHGDFTKAIHQCNNIWASLPGAGYGQHENKLAQLEAYYKAAGGHVAA